MKFVLLALVLLFSYASKTDASTINRPPSTINLISGLVGYWGFDGNDIAGVKAFDTSGSGNNGTLINGPVRLIGKIGQALSFNGSTQDVSIPNQASNQITGSFSLSAWVKSNASSGAPFIFVKWDSAANTRQYAMYQENLSPPKFGCAISSTGSSLTADRPSSASVTVGGWQHVVCVYNSSAQTLDDYVNGVLSNGTLAGTVPSSLFNSSNPLGIAVDSSAGGASFFKGSIDEVRLYNRALGVEEIKRLYNIGATLKINKPLASGNLQQGLVGSWSFDGTDIAGVIAYDRSGNANNGTLTNGPVRTVGKIGQALSFDGTNDYVQANDTNSLDLTTMSISAWVKASVLAGDNRTIVQKGQDNINATWNYAFGITSGGIVNLTIGGDGANTQNVSTGGSTLATGIWYHVVMTVDGSNIKTYVNGILDRTTAQTITPVGNAKPLFIGNRGLTSPTFDDWWNGRIDDVRVYNRALSAQEIKRLYNIGATLKINKPLASGNLQQGLVGSWSFDAPDIAGVTAYDRSGSANNGTLTNGPVRTIGKIGQALNFDGVDDYVSLGDITQAEINSNPLTVNAWVKATALPTNGAINWIASKGNSGVYEWEFEFFDDQAVLAASVYNDAGAQFLQAVGTTVLVTNRWYMATMVYNTNNTLQLYLNGVSDALDTTTNGSIHTIRTASLFTGERQDLGQSPWNGLIDDVRIYNRALSISEIKRLYNLGR